MPLAQTLVVMSSFSLPSRNLFSTAIRCSTVISPDNNATACPSWVIFCDSHDAALRVWNNKNTTLLYFLHDRFMKESPSVQDDRPMWSDDGKGHMYWLFAVGRGQSSGGGWGGLLTRLCNRLCYLAFLSENSVYISCEFVLSRALIFQKLNNDIQGNKTVVVVQCKIGI